MSGSCFRQGAGLHSALKLYLQRKVKKFAGSIVSSTFVRATDLVSAQSSDLVLDKKGASPHEGRSASIFEFPRT